MMSQKFLIAALVAAGAIGAATLASSQAAPAGSLPAPPTEITAPQGKQVAILAGGCFWGMEGLFEHVKGVQSVTAGYAGGTRNTANYPDVSSEQTNHAEAIRIVYDPAAISYGQLLQVYFSVAHDPTQVNGQLPDEGHSYRSAIFPQNAAQRAAAIAYIAAIERSHAFVRPLATHLENGAFFPAEAFHQQFMRHNPTHPYIVQWDMPRLRTLHERFPALYRG